MNTYIFTDPHFRPLDNAGATLPNSYLLFFETETLVPTPVYSDASLSTSLGVEVEADGDGEFPVMYMDPEVTYRVQFYDENDVLQWDVDPYTPPRDWPPGSIVTFFGDATARDAAYPPALWQVCDGSNGSPDMRERVPIGVGGSLSVGDTGGAENATTSEDGAHDHGGTTSEVVLDETNMPEHSHRLFVRLSSTQRGNTRGFGFASTAGIEGQVIDDAPYGYLDNSPSEGDPLVEPTGTDPATGHAHDITEELAHSHTVATLPPYLALWFLMRKTP